MKITLDQSRINADLWADSKQIFTHSDIQNRIARLAAKEAGLDTSDRFANYCRTCRRRNIDIEVTPDEPALTLDAIREHAGIRITPDVVYRLDEDLRELANATKRAVRERLTLQFFTTVETLQDVKLVTRDQAFNLRQLLNESDGTRARQLLELLLGLPNRRDD